MEKTLAPNSKVIFQIFTTPVQYTDPWSGYRSVPVMERSTDAKFEKEIFSQYNLMFSSRGHKQYAFYGR